MCCVGYYLLLLLLFLSRLVLLSASRECPHFSCGRFSKIGFPFSTTTNPKCGLAVMNCTGPKPQIQFSEKGKWYQVDDLKFDQSILIRDPDVQSHLESNRCDLMSNFTEKVSPFLAINPTGIRPFFKCKRGPPSPSFFKSFRNYSCNDYDLYFYLDLEKHLPALPQTLSSVCSVVCSTRLYYAPDSVSRTYKNTLLNDSDFVIKWQVHHLCWECHGKGGQCLGSSEQTFECANLKGASVRLKLAIGLSLGVGCVIITCIIFFLYQRREKNRFSKSSNLISRDISDHSLKPDNKIGLGAVIGSGCVLVMAKLIICQKWSHLSSNSIMFWKRKEKTQRVVEDFLKNYGSLVPRRYNYYDIKMITSSFKDKIGHGGFGEVYKGKLVDGRVVAVKLLNKANNDGEEFINEVASISRTSHVNVVNLLGFCFDGSKRALIYEFMANGSLEKFIYDQNPLEAESHLGWELLYQIAIGVARGLEYLHRGCNTRILHFDIKPHNILLDQDFIPKISDFGLAKLCPRNESIISMLGARGTAGYIAPEVFSRQFGGVSHKSDVYSYGMMVLEIVGKRKNIDVRVDHTSEIYFPKWIYRRIELNGELGLRGIMSKEEGEITRKMILVALWCIQTNPVDRPAMTKVVEMLEGRDESVSIPPKPYLCSPPRSPVGSSNT